MRDREGVYEMPTPPTIVERITELGFTPERGNRPRRCRAIVFSPNGTKIIGIQRIKPDRDPYITFPGGGLDEKDNTPLEGLYRELDEELEIAPDEVTFNGAVLKYEDEYFYIGWAKDEFKDLHMSSSSPELTESSYSGTYSPDWFEIKNLHTLNCLPEEISEIIVNSA